MTVSTIDTGSVLKEWIETADIPAPYAGAFCQASLFREPDYGADTVVVTRVYITQAQLERRRKAGIDEPNESPLASLYR